jgi:hypothetical protein
LPYIVSLVVAEAKGKTWPLKPPVVEGDHFSLLSAHNATAIAEKIQLLLMPTKA